MKILSYRERLQKIEEIIDSYVEKSSDINLESIKTEDQINSLKRSFNNFKRRKDILFIIADHIDDIEEKKSFLKKSKIVEKAIFAIKGAARRREKELEEIRKREFKKRDRSSKLHKDKELNR